FFQAEDGIRYFHVTGVQTCALPIFRDGVGFDGVVLSKLDGDVRGGAALSIRQVTGKPIMFASNGEKLDEFDAFHPDRMASRILRSEERRVAQGCYSLWEHAPKKSSE